VTAWVIWSEMHTGWRVRLPTGVADGYTRSLARAGLFEEIAAKRVVAHANSGCEPGEWLEWAMPDPLGRTV
jgi:hypothetical protein